MRHFIIRNLSICPDRLGINIGKVEKDTRLQGARGSTGGICADGGAAVGRAAAGHYDEWLRRRDE